MQRFLMLVTCTFTWKRFSTKSATSRCRLVFYPQITTFQTYWEHLRHLTYFIMERKYMRRSSLLLSNRSRNIMYASEIAVKASTHVHFLLMQVFFFFFGTSSSKQSMHIKFVHPNPEAVFPIS